MINTCVQNITILKYRTSSKKQKEKRLPEKRPKRKKYYEKRQANKRKDMALKFWFHSLIARFSQESKAFLGPFSSVELFWRPDRQVIFYVKTAKERLPRIYVT